MAEVSNTPPKRRVLRARRRQNTNSTIDENHSEINIKEESANLSNIPIIKKQNGNKSIRSNVSVNTTKDSIAEEISLNQSNASNSFMSQSNKKKFRKLRNHKNFVTIDETSPPEIIESPPVLDIEENTKKDGNKSGKKRKSGGNVTQEKIEPKNEKSGNLLLDPNNVSDGGSKSKKRRTYELEKTVNLIDDLKSASPFIQKKTPTRQSPRKSIQEKNKSTLSAISPILNNNNTIESTEDKTKFLHSEINDSLDLTFNLENSVNDVDTLKAASKKDLRISVLESNHKKTTEKVTQRNKNRVPKKSLEKITKWTPFFSASTPHDNTKKTTEKRKSLTRSSSTPLPSTAKKQNTTTNNNNNTSNLSNISAVKSTSKSLVKKIPNFAKIHERAVEKLESISEYKKRKDERANMLLSGKNPSVEEEKKKIKRQLKFAPNTVEKEKAPNYIPLPSTPIPKFKNIPPTPPSISSSEMRSKKELKNKKFDLDDPDLNGFNELEITNPFEIKECRKKSKSPKVSPLMKVAPYEIVTKKKSPFSKETAVPSKSPLNIKNSATKSRTPKGKENSFKAKPVEKIETKFNFKFGVTSTFSQGKTTEPFRFQAKSAATFDNNGFTRFGFKQRELVKPKTDRKEMAKALISKKVNLKNERREIIKGVRSNRRFELLMKMRPMH